MIFSPSPFDTYNGEYEPYFRRSQPQHYTTMNADEMYNRRHAAAAARREAQRRAEIEDYYRHKQMEEMQEAMRQRRRRQEYEHYVAERQRQQEYERMVAERRRQAEMEAAMRQRRRQQFNSWFADHDDESSGDESSSQRHSPIVNRHRRRSQQRQQQQQQQHEHEEEEEAEQPSYQLVRGLDGRIYKIPVQSVSPKEKRSSIHEDRRSGPSNPSPARAKPTDFSETDTEAKAHRRHADPQDAAPSIEGRQKDATKRSSKQKQNKKKFITVIVEDASDSESEDDIRNSVWRNRRPSPGQWMEPVEGF